MEYEKEDEIEEKYYDIEIKKLDNEKEIEIKKLDNEKEMVNELIKKIN